MIDKSKRIVTSNYGNLKKLEAASIEPIAISVIIPNWFSGRSMRKLAPTREMLKITREQYDVCFADILAKLSPQACWEALPTSAALLCYESAGVRCHRRLVAEWLESNLDVTITEFGYDRSVIQPYVELPNKDEVRAGIRKPNLDGQKELF
jgi:hypothetical protein